MGNDFGSIKRSPVLNMGNDFSIKRSPVQKCIYQRDIKKVRHLLESGEHEVEDSLTLEIAVYTGQYDMVKLLLDYGTFSKNRNECRVLDFSVWKSKNDIAMLLINNGFSIHGRNQFGETLPYVASCSNNAFVMNTVINLGLDVNNTTRNWTPLHVAAQRNHTAVLRVLLWHGCDMEIENSDANTAMKLALAHYHLPNVHYLLEAGAQILVADLEVKQVALRAPDLDRLVRRHLFSVKPLTDWCRTAIRRCLRERIPQKALVLPLPKFLQYFVRMNDVFEISPAELEGP